MEFKNTRRCITPFIIQCFVTIGVTLNMAGLGLVMGFVTGLLSQLRETDSVIVIDDSSASWIASLPGFSLVLGNFIVPSIMGIFGRRIANLCSLAVSMIGWIGIHFSNNVTLLLLSRLLQGVSMGMIAALGPVLIGEYTSPKNRGFFLMTISATISTGVFTIQTLATYLPWKICAVVCIGIVLFNMLIVILSPESPTFLADKERYDECRRVFRYLRGDSEDEELEKMITARMLAKKEQVYEVETFGEKFSSKVNYLKQTMKKREFYIPLLIMFHIFTLAHWSGINILTTYTADVYENVIGRDSGIDISLMIVIMGATRIFENIIGLIFVMMLRRRVVLFMTVGINMIAVLAIAAYSYARENQLLPFDAPIVGVILIHIQMFSVATGALPLGYVLAGELFPVEYKGLCGSLSMLVFSLNLSVNLKTVLVLLNSWGLYGTYCLYAGIIMYCLSVVGVLLPETKDRTLQDIEEEFRSR